MRNGKIFSIQEDGELIAMHESNFISEDDFQSMLERHHDLLAGDQMNSDSPRRWLLIKREMGVADDPGAGDRWSLDHLFIDQDGIPTLVEVKRSTDTRLRREVVGQVLDYAANAVVHWSIEKIRAEFERQCEKDNADSEERIAAFLESESDVDEETFWEIVKTNLQAGKIRLLFVADVIPTELRRIVEFLNTQMDPAEVLAVEIRQFIGQGSKTLVPRVIGQTAEAESRKKIKRAALTKFRLTVNGKVFANLPKRRAMLRFVKALVKEGRSPKEIDSAVSWRTFLYKIPPANGDETVAERLRAEYGLSNPKKICFLKKDEFVTYQDEHYAIAKQWGPKTHEALKVLTETFSPKTVSYEIES